MQFEEYVAVRGPALLRLAYLLCGDRGAAEDLTQTALLDTFRHWRRVQDAEHPDAYVRRVLVNAYMSAARRRSWGERPTRTGELPDRAAPRHTDPGVAVPEREALWQLLAGLPPRSRAVLVLRFYEDADDATIAAALSVTPSTVRSTASRALAALRRELDPLSKEVP